MMASRAGASRQRRSCKRSPGTCAIARSFENGPAVAPCWPRVGIAAQLENGCAAIVFAAFLSLYEFSIALLCMVVGNTHHGPKSCRHPSNKCELKNEADNTLYDFAHRKENKPRQQQGDEKAHRSLPPR